MAWTCELLDRVKNLWEQGLTATEISEVVDKSRNAIIGKLNRARNDGAKIQVRDTSSRPAAEKKVKPKPVKKFDAPAVPRGATKGSGRRALVPPSDNAASPPPPVLEPITQHNGWRGIVAEISALQSWQCRWPHGDPVTSFCRAPTETILAPYCDYHAGVALRAKNGKRAGE